MKLIATNIGNLTDARFFAAYTPEVLVLPWANGVALENALQWLEQVRPWIEGPDWAIRVNEKNSPEDLVLALKAQIKIIVLEGPTINQGLAQFEIVPEISDQVLEWVPDHQVQKVILSDITQLTKIDRLHSNIEVYLTIKSISDWDQMQATEIKIAGIVLQGSQEEKIGLKSFDEVQELLERFDLA